MRIKAFIWILIWYILPFEILCQKTNPDSILDINQRIYFFENKNESLSLTEIQNLKSEKWSKIPDNFLKFGYSSSYYWLKIEFKPDVSPEFIYWWFESEIPQEASFYQVVDHRLIKENHTGTKYIYDTRDIKSRNLAFSFTLDPQHTTTIYARLHNDVGSMYCSTYLDLASGFLQKEKRDNRLWSFFFSFMIFSAFFTLGLWGAFKERIYLYYTFYLLCTALMTISINGFGTEWFWPNSTLLANISQVIWTFGSAGFLMFFIYELLAHLLNSYKWFKIHIRITAGLLLVCVFITLSFNSLPKTYIPKLLSFGNMCMMLAVINMAFMLFVGIFKKYKPTFYFFLAFFPVLGIALSYYFRNIGLINWTFLRSPLAIIPPFIFEIILLFSALMVRFKSLSKIKEENQRLSLETQQKLQSERERISRDLHDHMGAQLSHIVRSTEWIHKHAKALNQNETEVLSSLGITAKEAVATLRESIWMLNREKITKSEFIERFKKWALVQINTQQKVNLKITEDLIDNHYLSPEQSLHIYRILQETLNNALKYAFASQIEINFKEDLKQVFYVSVKDNGIGFEVGEIKSNAYGLENIKQRIKILQGNISISSKKEIGTQIDMMVP
jgi:signal transduction histidine kinase